MTLPDRLADAITENLNDVEQNLEEANDELNHGPLGRAWGYTSITAGAFAAGLGVIATLTSVTHGIGMLALGGVLILIGYWMLATHEYQDQDHI